MPTLDWIGKDAVVNHHQDIPFHLLEEKQDRAIGTPDADNLLIEGDNLVALKALLPHYAGQVDCVYIDPPYNTGNEDWAYNDNVNSPEIREWLGETVGKKTEDLSRHDKWLCMMTPRLMLLHELLAEDGSFWMSIDDNEVHHARALLDEVFGRKNFVTTVCWQKIYTIKNSAKHFSEMHDYILVYAKSKEDWDRNLLGRTEETDSDYSNPDDDPNGPWISNALQSRNYYSKGEYSIECPGGRVIEGPPSGTYWRMKESKLWRLHEQGRVWWGEDGNNDPRIKRYLSEVKDGVVPSTMWFHEDVGTNSGAKVDLREMFEGETPFQTPKPVSLIERILGIATDPGDLVLDSFTGSATTGHAVLKKNAEDDGDRQFILVEMEENVAKNVAHERLKRAIEGYEYEGTEKDELMKEKLTVRTVKNGDQLYAESEQMKEQHADEYDSFRRRSKDGYFYLYGEKTIEEAKEGLGGSVRYLTLGPEMETTDTDVGSQVTYDDLARHLHYLETGQPLDDDAALHPPLVNTANGTALYLLYGAPTGDGQAGTDGNVLTREVLNALPNPDADVNTRVVYGEACRLGDDVLDEHGITFRQIPYDVRTA
ncbi:site-specific DNA-methyltransferase [Salinibacter ruber]|uniref:site-specific DNA-methyltransferase n=1 Tax=Salinibacter ruber TaxID=146919 RepID=UPI002072B350|nr:site-specific DNA-methyltransferase [Salinibacter ruber]